MARSVYILCIGIGVLTGCGRSADAVSVSVVNLIDEFPRAERRPEGGFAVAARASDGIERPSIVAAVPSRAIWSLPLPEHGRLRAALALDPASAPGAGVRFRVGVSDHRVYEALAHRTLEPGSAGWTAFEVDLSAYAGFKWSLFYRPDRITWRVVLAADPVGQGTAVAIWGSPEITTDRQSARKYVERRRARR